MTYDLQSLIFAEKIKSFLKSEPELFLFWKGRVALYALLLACGISKDDEVVMPAYTCVVVPNAIIYTGAKPIYVDNKPDTYNIDVSKIEAAITPKTKVIICQNTYGLSSNIEEIIEIAKKYNLYTIEDCCHGFGGTYNGKPNGTFLDAAFFSTQWNKPFSTGLGGMALINNEKLIPKMKELDKNKIAPSLKEKAVLKFLYFVRRYMLRDFSYWFLVWLYRLLSKNNLIIGSSQGPELEKPEMPKDFFKGFSATQAKEGVENLKSLDSLLVLRKNNAKIYTNFLEKNGKKCVKKELFKNHSFLKYPILVKNRDKFMELAQKDRIRLGDWFVSPLHPILKNFEYWFFKKDDYPCASEIADRVVNIPTETKDIEKVLDFLDRNIDFVV